MGLREKRRLAELKDEKIPYIEKYISETCKHPIKLSVDFSAIEENMNALDRLQYYGIEYLGSVMGSIGADKVGQEAFKAKVDEILIKPVFDKSQKSIYLEGKTLVISANFSTEDHTDIFDTSDMQRRIEDLL